MSERVSCIDADRIDYTDRDDGADRIDGGLWMSGRPPAGHFLFDHGFRSLVLCEIDYQPTLRYRNEWTQIHDEAVFPGLRVQSCPFEDLALTPAEGYLVEVTSRDLNILPQPTLVTCFAGRNRSGLVVARALMKKGKKAAGAIRLVQDRRRRGLFGAALENPNFIAWLNSREALELCLRDELRLADALHECDQ